MKVLLRSFAIFIREITQDYMLIGVLVAPPLIGLAFRFGVPFAEELLTAHFSRDGVISPYYLLFDLFLCLVTPYFFLFASVLVMLSEYDENMVNYLAVTPLGRGGYIVSRLVLPAALSFPVSVLLVKVFALTEWPSLLLPTACLLSSVMSVATAMLLFSFSNNRVEGLALGKMANIYSLGLLVPFFIDSKVQYFFAPLPSLWLAKMCKQNDYSFFPAALLISLAWIWLMYRKFQQKLN